MKMQNGHVVLYTTVLIFLALSLAGAAYGGTVGLITKEELSQALDDPNLVVLDVRTGRDWKSSEFKIKGAVRANPYEFDKWVENLSKDKQFVTYCA